MQEVVPMRNTTKKTEKYKLKQDSAVQMRVMVVRMAATSTNPAAKTTTHNDPIIEGKSPHYSGSGASSPSAVWETVLARLES
jgi:hypothetical protein